MLADTIEGLGALDAAQEDAGLPIVLAKGQRAGRKWRLHSQCTVRRRHAFHSDATTPLRLLAYASIAH